MASTYLDLRAITHCEAARSGDDRQARHRLLQRETRHNRDMFPADTMAYDNLLVRKDFNVSAFSGELLDSVDHAGLSILAV